MTDASLARPEISGIFKLLTLLVRLSISFYKVVFMVVILIPYVVIRFCILVMVFDVKVFNVY